MKRVLLSSRYKKDFKKYKNQPAKVEKILKFLRMLANDEPLPASYKAHRLVGNYHGCMECHIESDLLLIWIDELTNTIEVLRLGSHSELF